MTNSADIQYKSRCHMGQTVLTFWKEHANISCETVIEEGRYMAIHLFYALEYSEIKVKVFQNKNILWSTDM